MQMHTYLLQTKFISKMITPQNKGTGKGNSTGKGMSNASKGDHQHLSKGNKSTIILKPNINFRSFYYFQGMLV